MSLISFLVKVWIRRSVPWTYGERCWPGRVHFMPSDCPYLPKTPRTAPLAEAPETVTPSGIRCVLMATRMRSRFSVWPRLFSKATSKIVVSRRLTDSLRSPVIIPTCRKSLIGHRRWIRASASAGPPHSGCLATRSLLRSPRCRIKNRRASVDSRGPKICSEVASRRVHASLRDRPPARVRLQTRQREFPRPPLPPCRVRQTSLPVPRSRVRRGRQFAPPRFRFGNRSRRHKNPPDKRRWSWEHFGLPQRRPPSPGSRCNRLPRPLPKPRPLSQSLSPSESRSILRTWRPQRPNLSTSRSRARVPSRIPCLNRVRRWGKRRRLLAMPNPRSWNPLGDPPGPNAPRRMGKWFMPRPTEVPPIPKSRLSKFSSCVRVSSASSGTPRHECKTRASRRWGRQISPIKGRPLLIREDQNPDRCPHRVPARLGLPACRIPPNNQTPPPWIPWKVRSWRP